MQLRECADHISEFVDGAGGWQSDGLSCFVLCGEAHCGLLVEVLCELWVLFCFECCPEVECMFFVCAECFVHGGGVIDFFVCFLACSS